MASEDEFFQSPDELTGTERLVTSLKKNPFVTLGYGGCFAVAAYGIYNYKNHKANIKPSHYFIQLRVIAQGVAIGTITLGAAWQMIDHFVLNPKKKPEKKQ